MNLVALSSAALVGVQGRDLFLAEVVFLVLHQEADRFRGQVHVVAGVADDFGRHLGQRTVLRDLLADILHQHRQRRVGAFADLVRVTYCVTAGRGSPMTRGRRPWPRPPCEAAPRPSRTGRLAFRQGAVERVGRRHGADQDQHDQAHALLAVVRAVGEAHAGAGQDQHAADPDRRRLVALGRGIQRGVLDHQLEQSNRPRRRRSRTAATAAAHSRSPSPAPSPRPRCRRGRASAHWRCRRR